MLFLTSITVKTVATIRSPEESALSPTESKLNTSHEKETNNSDTNESLDHQHNTIISPKKSKSCHYGKIPEENFQVFYNVPIVKFWTSTLFYLGFLILQAYLLLFNFNV